MSTRFGFCVGHSANSIVLETQFEFEVPRYSLCKIHTRCSKLQSLSKIVAVDSMEYEYEYEYVAFSYEIHSMLGT